MPQKIIQLTESVINQIAAGEVVENPASIVKELIENSLDAKASQITISIRGGGRDLIEVEDDGCGMSSVDAKFCFQRHATSKIREAKDLFALKSMGFRGEALAAISAISHFELKTSDGSEGTWIRGKGDAIEQIEPCARNPGSTISIRSLFFNVPARKKFQKSAPSTLAGITKLIQTIGSAHPEIAFSYFNEGQKVFTLEPQTKKERIEAVFGPFSFEVDASFLWGLFSSPEEAKGRRQGQFIFINGRPIFSPMISRAVQMGYGTRLRENMYPPFILFLKLDEDKVDVNVHPQKREVRLFDEKGLFQKIESAVESMFTGSFSEERLSFPRGLEFQKPNSFSCREEAPFPQMTQEQLPWELKERVLTILGKYCLIEKEGLFLVDLAAAHARVMFEQLLSKKMEIQPLLWPLELDSEDPEMVTALQDIGIDCRWIGNQRIAVDALPSMIDVSGFPSFFETFKEGKKIDRTASQYCHHLNKRYSFEEAIDLWLSLLHCKDPLYDPLGKRIWTRIEQTDLDIWMSRGLTKSKIG